VADRGSRAAGLRYAHRTTPPEGVSPSASDLLAPTTPIAFGRLYTLGIRFLIGRAHSASLLPDVMKLVAERRLRPEEITTRVVGWEEAPEAWLEETIKLVVTRA